MIRDLHDTLEDFRPPADPNWSSRGADPDGGFHILHNDIGPWNLVVDEEDWVIIDWDEAAPGRVEWELALVVQSFVPLWPDGQLSDAEIARRIVTFGEGYHATSHELRSVVELVPQRCRRFVEMIDDGVRLGDPQLVRMLRQGHREVWAVAAAHASARASTWQGLLG
jgi:Ser/Thr protein kinase RdoA (MazF antagonist)